MKLTVSITRVVGVPRVANGEMILPQKPGFGLEFDESAVKKFAIP